MKNKINITFGTLLPVLLLAGLLALAGCGPAATAANNGQPSIVPGANYSIKSPALPQTPSGSAIALAPFPPVVSPLPPSDSSGVVSVVLAGYINHGPLQPTVKAVKDIVAKYGDKVRLTVVDLSTTAGQNYFKANDLTAHMNVIINGKYEYSINGKDVVFQWFEGVDWTKEDLDAVLSSLVNK